MNIGYIRFGKQNSYTKRLNAICHSFYGMELISFTLKDVNIEDKTISGEYYTGEKWERKTVPIPKIINNMPFRISSKNKKVYEFLNKNSLLLFHRFGTKSYVEHLLKENELITEMIIPSRIINDVDDVQDMFESYDKLFFKPIDSTQGRGAFILNKIEDKYEITEYNTKGILNRDEVIGKISKLKMPYLAQKYIKSTTPNNLPFDIRVQYEKNGKGQWIKVQSYARVGLANSLVSNLSKGGGVVRTKIFLKTNFGEKKGTELFEKLNLLLKGFPSKFERLFDFNVSTVAIDIGLDNDEFYMFETNTFPGGTFARGEVAMVRAAHAKHLMNKLKND